MFLPIFEMSISSEEEPKQPVKVNMQKKAHKIIKSFLILYFLFTLILPQKNTLNKRMRFYSFFDI